MPNNILINEVQIPPQNIEAEQSLLGSLLIDKDAIVKVADLARPEDFYKESHAKIYETMQDLYAKHEPIDILSLVSRLEEMETLEEVGGRSYLMSLANTVPTASNVTHYANIVQKKATLRRLIESAAEISKLGYEKIEDVETLLDRAEQKIFQVSQKFLKKVFVPIKEILTEAFDRIDELHKEKGKLRGIPTGFKSLDNVLAGFQKSDLIILAARPSIGKSSLALDFARHAAVRAKVPVGIFSLEMGKDQVVDRLLCSEAGIDLWRMRTGRLSSREEDDDFPLLGQAMGVLSEAPIYIDDTATANIMEIRTKARRLQTERGLGLLIIDYLQLMEGRGSNDGRVQEVAEITRSLKGIARELDIPVIAISQLSRATEARTPAIPKLSDLRESGCLAAETLIMNTETGELIPLAELAEKNQNISVLSLNQKLKLENKKISRVFYSGKKIVYKLTTNSGKNIRASANHPFYTLNGWQRLDELKKGEKIATPRIIPSNNPRTTAVDQKLKNFTQSDICWDEINSIKKQGVEKVYDITVPKTHNFVANDIIVHNSIEQDADVVIFIYRKAKDRGIKEISPAEEHIAQLHIAKHRNGPTGMIELFFNDEKVRFENLEKKAAEEFIPEQANVAGEEIEPF